MGYYTSDVPTQIDIHALDLKPLRNIGCKLKNEDGLPSFLACVVGRRTFCDSSTFRNSEILSQELFFADSETSKFLNFEF